MAAFSLNPVLPGMMSDDHGHAMIFQGQQVSPAEDERTCIGIGQMKILKW